MKRYKIIGAVLLLMSSISTNAQLLVYKTVIANGGESYTSAGLSADWTVGQNIANQYTSAGLIVAEGFHPVYIASQSTNNVKAVSSTINSVTAYPNPTNNVLNISIQQNEPRSITLQVLDVTGKLVQNMITLPAQLSISTEIDLSSVNPGTYIILLKANTENAYSMKVIKN